MAFSIFGIPVSRGIAIGRAVLLASSRRDVVEHYFIEPDQQEAEMARLLAARTAVSTELQTLRGELPKDTPPEIAALLDVHLMLLGDSMLVDGVRRWIEERHYNAEWALSAQLKVLTRQFDEMEDEYLRERRADLEQVVERLLATLAARRQGKRIRPPSPPAGTGGDPLVMVARDIAPADMLQFRQSVFAGFVTDVGGRTSHSAIVAKSLDIPAIVGSRNASRLIQQDDWVVVDGDAGVVLVDPSPMLLEEYQYKQRQTTLERERLNRLRHAPAITLDREPVELLANIALPEEAETSRVAGAMGVGLFRSEFLFMNRAGEGRSLPDEEEQYNAYRTAVQAMPELPVTIRTIDIGADKPLARGMDTSLNPALGLRAIRWSLAEPDMFLVQLRALLRAAVHGRLQILIPMLTHAWQIRQTVALLERAKHELDAAGIPRGNPPIGAMIEVPAAALTLPLFIRHFDFLSIGTNDLVQYTLAIDRADEAVAALYDPLHPAVLRLLADTIRAGNAAGRHVSVCGEMAGDASYTRLLLGLGLRSFSMQPAQLLAVKREVLHSDTRRLSPLAEAVLQAGDSQEQQVALQALNTA